MPGVPSTASPGQPRNFVPAATHQANRVISGVTRSASGAALGNCTVHLFNAATFIREQVTTSDGSGNYSFTVDPTQLYFEVAYLVGAPDVAGTTVNTLAGA